MTFKQAKKIPLTQGKFALVDEEDYEYVMQWKWYCAGRYASRGDYTSGSRTTIHMHRVILERMLGHGDFAHTDHISGDGYDNRRRNLRPATAEQNGSNRKTQVNSTSGYVGVTWNARIKRWRVRLQASGRRMNLGHYKDKKEAALAYNEAAKKHHGEFAVLNEVK